MSDENYKDLEHTQEIYEFLQGVVPVGAAAISLGRRAWLNDICPEYRPIMEQTCNTTPGFAF
jgi:hypothetical protein